jgi:transposase-like protein
MTQTDLMTMARFLVLPGASELLEAFSQIPPGRLRESAVAHVQAIAETYSSAPVEQQMPDPLLTAAQGAPEPVRVIETPRETLPALTPIEALSNRRRGVPKSDDPDVKAIELALQGMSPQNIAVELNMPISSVMWARKKALRAGLIFPKIVGRRGGSKKKKKFQASFAMTLDDLDMRGIGIATAAASRRGLTLESYIERRRITVEMAQDGRHIQAIINAVKEDEPTIRSWLNKARAAGLPVPYVAVDYGMANVAPVEPEPEPEPEPEAIVPVQSSVVVNLRSAGIDPPPRHRAFSVSLEGLSGTQVSAIERGAALLSVSVEEYLEVRRQALEMMRNGIDTGTVAKTLNITPKMSSNWRQRAIDAGVLIVPRKQA